MHGMSFGPRNRACPHNGSILTRKTKSLFSRTCSSITSNLIYNVRRYPPLMGGHIPEKFSNHYRDTSNQTSKKNLPFLLITRLTKIAVLHKHIWLKFRTRIGDPKVNLRITFGANLISIPRIINDFTRKTKSNFCHAYRLGQDNKTPCFSLP